MSRRKKEKKAEKAQQKARRRQTGGYNPLYPEKRESDAKGILIALGSVAGAIAALALIVTNFSYYVHPERLEGQTQMAQQTVAEAGEGTAAQAVTQENAATAETAAAAETAAQAEDAAGSAQAVNTPVPGDGSGTGAEPAPQQAVSPEPATPQAGAAGVAVGDSGAAAPSGGQTQYGEGQDIESLEGTGVRADGQTNAEAAAPQQAEPAPQAQSGPSQIFADSSTRYLTDSEAASLSQADIQTAINEIFARHGYIFETAEIYAHFQQYDWYQPTVSKDSFNTAVFSDIERSNVELLSRYRH